MPENAYNLLGMDDSCPHPRTQVEESIKYPGDPLRGYCYLCGGQVKREDLTGPWVYGE